MGFFQLSCSFRNHLFKAPHDLLFFHLLFGDITTNLDEFGDLAVLFPDGENGDLDIACITALLSSRQDLADGLLVANDIFEGADKIEVLTLLIDLLEDRMAFPFRSPLQGSIPSFGERHR